MKSKDASMWCKCWTSKTRKPSCCWGTCYS